ncbi:hypothetical protein L0F63_004330 [Massospora cicadina]|nr:hypothetical protein L0F63_004330 [Massospora cicadina]
MISAPKPTQFGIHILMNSPLKVKAGFSTEDITYQADIHGWLYIRKRCSPLGFELSAERFGIPDIAFEALDTHAYCSWLDVLSQYLQDRAMCCRRSLASNQKGTPSVAELTTDPFTSEFCYPSRLLLASRSASTSRTKRFTISFKS